MIVLAISTTQNFTKKSKIFFLHRFWGQKIKTDTVGAYFQKSGHNQPPPIQDRVKKDEGDRNQL